MELLGYKEPSEHFVSNGVFDHQAGRYHGKGWLRWDPESGARIDLAVDRSGPPLPRTIGFGFQGWLRPQDYTTIRMRIEGFDWVIAPHVGLVDRMDVMLRSHLSVDVQRLISRESLSHAKPDGNSGHITLALPERTELFTPSKETTHVAGREVMSRQTFNGAIATELDGLSVLGKLDDKNRVRVSWNASELALPRTRTWEYGHALRAAISLCTGCGARTLERGLCRDGKAYREHLPFREPARLGAISWFRPFEACSADECVKLSLSLVNDPVLLTIAWGVLSQLLASRDQSAWGVSELLVATTMEGLMRSLENRPFRSGERYNPCDALLTLREDRFPSTTTAQCESAILAYRRLRHRNAHPDWLTTEERMSRDALTQSSADMSFLSSFYGRILFDLAGLPDVVSRISLEGT